MRCKSMMEFCLPELENLYDQIRSGQVITGINNIIKFIMIIGKKGYHHDNQSINQSIKTLL